MSVLDDLRDRLVSEKRDAGFEPVTDETVWESFHSEPVEEEVLLEQFDLVEITDGDHRLILAESVGLNCNDHSVFKVQYENGRYYFYSRPKDLAAGPCFIKGTYDPCIPNVARKIINEYVREQRKEESGLDIKPDHEAGWILIENDDLRHALMRSFDVEGVPVRFYPDLWNHTFVFELSNGRYHTVARDFIFFRLNPVVHNSLEQLLKAHEASQG